MIFDKLKNINNYKELAPYGEKILDFTERAEREQLPEGRYELDGNDLFAMIQCYETKAKEEGRMESHKKYADVQYLIDGEERIYEGFVDELEVEEDRTPGADLLFYRPGEAYGYQILKHGAFGYYAPGDAHMPCITHKEKQMVKKIVFKLAVK